MAALLNLPTVNDYVEKWCGSINDHCMQSGFISKLSLFSEMPVYIHIGCIMFGITAYFMANNKDAVSNSNIGMS